MSVKAAGRFDQKKTSVFTNKPLDKINSQKCLCPNNLTNVVFLLLFFIEQKQNGILVLNFGQTNFSPLQIWCRVWTHLVEQLTTNKSDDSPRPKENLLIGFKGQGLPCQNIKIENMSFVFEMSPMFHVPTHRGCHINSMPFYC